METCDKRDGYIKLIEIRTLEMCIADPNKIRIEAMATSSLNEILPYIAAAVPRSIFSEESGYVTWKEDLMTYSVYSSGKVTVTQLRDREDALVKLAQLKQKLNDIWARRDRIDIHAKKRNVGPLEIYKLLPRSNCGKCGMKTCLAFASKLLLGLAKLKDCLELEDDKGTAAVRTLMVEAGLQEAI